MLSITAAAVFSLCSVAGVGGCSRWHLCPVQIQSSILGVELSPWMTECPQRQLAQWDLDAGVAGSTTSGHICVGGELASSLPSLISQSSSLWICKVVVQ